MLRVLLLLIVLAALIALILLWLSRSRATTKRPGLKEMDDNNFRDLIAQSYRNQGKQVSVHPDGWGGPAQLVLEEGRSRELLQCRHWRAKFVGADPIAELLRAVREEGAAGGIAVTTGTFTRDARELAEGNGLSLVDGDGLRRLLDGRR